MLLYIIVAVLVSGACSTHLIGILGPSQFHAQDIFGQYTYGYSGGPSAKVEAKTIDGITRGGYSYIDPYGILQHVQYTADPINGFRVAGTNIPQPHEGINPIEAVPIVNYAKIQTEFRKEFVPLTPVEPPVFKKIETDATVIKFNQVGDKTQNLPIPGVRAPEPIKLASIKGFLPTKENSVVQSIPALKLPVSNAVPLTYPYYLRPIINYDSSIYLADRLAKINQSPNLDAFHKKEEQPNQPDKLTPREENRRKRSVIFVPSPSQYEVKDIFGNYAYGYQNELSAKTESRSIDGNTYGAYSYVDANGIVQNVNYIADSNGFRVAATNLPV